MSLELISLYKTGIQKRPALLSHASNQACLHLSLSSRIDRLCCILTQTTRQQGGGSSPTPILCLVSSEISPSHPAIAIGPPHRISCNPSKLQHKQNASPLGQARLVHPPTESPEPDRKPGLKYRNKTPHHKQSSRQPHTYLLTNY